MRRHAVGRRVALGAGLTLLAVSLTALPRANPAAAQGPLFSSVASPLPDNIPGQGFESLSLAEIGDLVGLSGTNRALGTVVVALDGYGCQSGTWNTDTCTTTAGSTFAVPITFNIYNVGAGNTVGSPIATRTQTFTVPYRPSDDDVHCPPAADGGNGRWFDATNSTCNRGLATTVTFDFSQQGIVLPAQVIYGVAFNTTHAGYSPMGTGAACFSTSGGCGYDLLQVGLNPGGASVGTDVDPVTIYQNSSAGSTYCDNGTAGTGTFRLDSPGNGCWAGTTPAVQFNERAVQTLVVDNTSTCPNATFSTIQSAVSVAQPGDIVSVCKGTYNELVTINTPNITLQGAEAGVDARSGRPVANETFVDGTGGGGGFLVNADGVTIDGFTVQNNGSATNSGAGIDTTAAHSGYTLVNTLFQGNSIGIYANSSGSKASLIQHDLFLNNNNNAQPNSGNGVYTDQGSSNITVDSNVFESQTDGSIVFNATTSPGEHAVTVTNNAITDAEASFASVTGLTVSGNSISGSANGGLVLAGGNSFTSVDSNTIQSDGGPGVQICNCGGAGYAANGRSVSITNNTLTGNTNEIEVDAGGATVNIQTSFNRIAGSTGAGVINNSTVTVNAFHNWWGCNGGPNQTGCDTLTGSGTTAYKPWLVLTATPSATQSSGPVQIAVDVNHDSQGNNTASLGNLPDGTIISFAATVGNLSSTSVPLATGTASVTLSPNGAFGNSTVTSTLDGQGSVANITFSPPLLSIANVAKAAPHSGTTTMNFTVTLSAPTDTTVTVSYESSDGTATTSSSGLGNPDYNATSGTLTFAPGVTSQKIPVTIYGYAFNEAAETFTVNLANASSNALIGEGTGTGKITSTIPKPAITVVAPVAQVVPGKFAVFAVNMSGPSDQTVTVKFATVGLTALANEDFKPVSGVLTFTPGITSLFVYVNTVNESPSDPPQTFNLVLTTPVNATVVAPGKATATIR